MPLANLCNYAMVPGRFRLSSPLPLPRRFPSGQWQTLFTKTEGMEPMKSSVFSEPVLHNPICRMNSLDYKNQVYKNVRLETLYFRLEIFFFNIKRNIHENSMCSLDTSKGGYRRPEKKS